MTNWEIFHAEFVIAHFLKYARRDGLPNPVIRLAVNAPLILNFDLVVRADPVLIAGVPLKGKIYRPRLRQCGGADFKHVLAETAIVGVAIGGIFPIVNAPMDQRRAW